MIISGTAIATAYGITLTIVAAVDMKQKRVLLFRTQYDPD